MRSNTRFDRTTPELAARRQTSASPSRRFASLSGWRSLQLRRRGTAHQSTAGLAGLQTAAALSSSPLQVVAVTLSCTREGVLHPFCSRDGEQAAVDSCRANSPFCWCQTGAHFRQQAQRIDSDGRHEVHAQAVNCTCQQSAGRCSFQLSADCAGSA